MARLRTCVWLVLAAVALDSATTFGSTFAQIGVKSSSVPSGSVTTRELVEIGGLSGLEVSPDGAYAVVRVDRQDIADNRTSLEWKLVNLRDGRVNAIAAGGAPRWDVNGFLATETPQWSPDSKWIYFRKLQGEEAQLWRVGRSGAGLQQLTHDPSDVSAFIVDGGGAVHYAVGPATREEIKAAEAVEQDNGVLLDGGIIMGFPITHSFPVNGRMATYRLSPTAKYFGRSTLLGETPLRAMTLTSDNNGTRPSDKEVSRQFDTLWDETGGGFLPFEPGKTARAKSASLNRSAAIARAADDAEDQVHPTESGRLLSWAGKGDWAHCVSPICTEADALFVVGWTADGRELIFQTRTFGTVRLNSWSIEANTVRTVLQTEGVLGSADSGTAGECQLAGEEAICIAAAADQPPRVVGVNISSGAVRILLDPNPGLSPDRLGIASKVTLTDRFGSSTYGYVVLPRQRDRNVRLPLVITSYSCGGFLLGGSGRDVPEHVLAGMGYAVVCVDQSARAVRRAPGFLFTAYSSQLSGLDFFEAAVRTLDQQGLIDPERVLLTGFSGSATNTAFAITQSRMFTAAEVATQGSLDAVACYLAANYRSCRDWAVTEGQKPPYDSRTGMLANSPAWNVDKVAAPLLMQLPESEYNGMMQLYGALLDYDRAVEMYIFGDAFHYKNNPKQRLAVYDRNVDWANFWLFGKESNDPRQAPQNARWAHMRGNQCKLFVGENAMPNPPWYCRQ